MDDGALFVKVLLLLSDFAYTYVFLYLLNSNETPILQMFDLFSLFLY